MLRQLVGSNPTPTGARSWSPVLTFRFYPVMLQADLLDLHLSRSIARYSPKEERNMRGMQRLANATQTVLKDMDAEAGKVADDLIAAQADSRDVLDGFQRFVGEIKANTAQVRDVLAQLTNGSTTSEASGGGTPLPPSPPLS